MPVPKEREAAALASVADLRKRALMEQFKSFFNGLGVSADMVGCQNYGPFLGPQ